VLLLDTPEPPRPGQERADSQNTQEREQQHGRDQARVGGDQRGLRRALRLLTAENAFLHGENKRLVASLKAATQQIEQMSGRYRKLADYVTTLRDWAAAATAASSEQQPRHASVTENKNRRDDNPDDEKT
jgi:hypothetical protein